MAVAPRVGPFLGGGLGGALLHRSLRALEQATSAPEVAWQPIAAGCGVAVVDESIEGLLAGAARAYLTARTAVLVVLLAVVGAAFVAGLACGCSLGLLWARVRVAQTQNLRLERLQGYAGTLRRHA